MSSPGSRSAFGLNGGGASSRSGLSASARFGGAGTGTVAAPLPTTDTHPAATSWKSPTLPPSSTTLWVTHSSVSPLAVTAARYSVPLMPMVPAPVFTLKGIPNSRRARAQNRPNTARRLPERSRSVHSSTRKMALLPSVSITAVSRASTTTRESAPTKMRSSRRRGISRSGER